MKNSTRRRKEAARLIPQAYGQDLFAANLAAVICQGKIAFDSLSHEVGKMLVEAIMYMDREEVAGPDYRPSDPTIQKWASQQGSVFIGDQKVKVQKPRVRGPKGELPLESYEALKQPGQFSEELLSSVLCGLSARKYEETINGAAKAFGVSSSSASRHVVEATTRQLKAFAERDLSDFRPFAIYLDTVHRAKKAFIVALGVDLEGNKRSLGFWEGATENSEICTELLADLERRGLKLSRRVLFITDGGKGVIKALKDKFGKKLIHQRCTIHKDRNIQRHLPKKYRKRAHDWFRTALNLTKLAEAQRELSKLEQWLETINASAANSLREARHELLTLHRLKVPSLLRKALHSTNPIESMFARVRKCESNVKHYRGSKMAQRWLASVLLSCEKGFQKVRGHESIKLVIEEIKSQQEVDQMKKAA